MTQEDSVRERPPPSVRGKAPGGHGTADDVLDAAGWGGNTWEQIGVDDVVKWKPDFVQRDDDEAFRQGFRP